MNKAQKHLAFYARTACGTPDDLEHQFDAIRNTIPGNLRHLPVEFYGDLGSGVIGFEPDANGRFRRGLRKLVEDIRAGNVHSVHLASAHRLARDPGMCVQFEVICREHDVMLYVRGTLPSDELKLWTALSKASDEYLKNDSREKQAAGRSTD